MNQKPERKRPHRQGSIFLLLLLLLPVVILFVGFAVDVSHIQRVRAELRSAADISAKTAAATLSRTQDMAAARAAAIDIAAANKVAGQPLTLDPDHILFGNAARQADGSFAFSEGGYPVNAVQVSGRRTSDSADGPVNSFFGRFYGHEQYQPVIDSWAAFIDVDICLVLDRSGSMKVPVLSSDSPSSDYFNEPPGSNSRWVALDRAVRLFTSIMNSTPAEEQVGLVTFASEYTHPATGVTWPKASIDQPLTYHMPQIETPLDNLLATVWDGATDIGAGIEFGRQTLTATAARPFAQKIMVVFTDGVDTSGNDPTLAATAAAAEGVLIHTITFSDSADQSQMQYIASIGGGKHFHADNASDLDSIFREIAASLAVLIH